MNREWIVAFAALIAILGALVVPAVAGTPPAVVSTLAPADCDSVEFVTQHGKLREVVATFRGPWVAWKASSDLGALPDTLGASSKQPRGFHLQEADVILSAWLEGRAPGTVLEKTWYRGKQSATRPVATWTESGLAFGEGAK